MYSLDESNITDTGLSSRHDIVKRLSNGGLGIQIMLYGNIFIEKITKDTHAIFGAKSKFAISFHFAKLS